MPQSRRLFAIAVLLLTLSEVGLGLTQAEDDLVTVVSQKGYSVAYFRSSIKALPPESKKVWILTNGHPAEQGTKARIGSIRSNILFNCVYKTYSTLAVINYSEPNAMGKKILQTDTGFNLADDPVPEGSALSIIQKQICNG
jgi:hypothetical protein